MAIIQNKFILGSLNERGHLPGFQIYPIFESTTLTDRLVPGGCISGEICDLGVDIYAFLGYKSETYLRNHYS